MSVCEPVLRFISNNVLEPNAYRVVVCGPIFPHFHNFSYKSGEMRTNVLMGVTSLEFTVNAHSWSKQNIIICFWFSVSSRSLSRFSCEWINGRGKPFTGRLAKLKNTLNSTVKSDMEWENGAISHPLSLLWGGVHLQELVVKSFFNNGNQLLRML